MKSIKPFKLFESTEDLKHIVIECEDILLDINDEGFKTEISKGTSPHDWILVNISKKEKFLVDDIKETVERLIEYLSKLGFKTYNSSDNYPKIRSKGIMNPYNFNVEYNLSITSIQFNKTNLPHFARNIDSYIKTTESKKEVYKSIVSDIKYDLQDILIELVDENFKYQININDWNKNYKLINDNEVVKWLSLEISKEGDWNLTEVEDYLMRVVEFLSLKGLYPLFDPKPQTGLNTILISNHSDIFKNRMHKVAGTTNTFAYDIQFKTDDVS
jgi:hypothetical protein